MGMGLGILDLNFCIETEETKRNNAVIIEHHYVYKFLNF